jgi:hypothetical protein
MATPPSACKNQSNLGASASRNGWLPLSEVTGSIKTMAVKRTAMLGILFEILQIFVPGREAAVGDALANTIGVAIGATPFVIVQDSTRFPAAA